MTPAVTLVPLTEGQRAAFFAEEIANYADQQVRDAGWPREGAVERARDELTPVLERDLATGTRRGDRVWAALNRSVECVGWVWVKPLEPGVAFLEQITVAEPARRQGYGRAILHTLEELLAGERIQELRLNVNRANAPAKALYERAGYEEAGGDARRRFLRKRLGPRS